MTNVSLGNNGKDTIEQAIEAGGSGLTPGGISGLPAADALTGNEIAVTLQDGIVKRTTAKAIADLGGGGVSVEGPFRVAFDDANLQSDGVVWFAANVGDVIVRVYQRTVTPWGVDTPSDSIASCQIVDNSNSNAAFTIADIRNPGVVNGPFQWTLTNTDGNPPQYITIAGNIRIFIYNGTAPYGPLTMGEADFYAEVIRA